MDVQFVWSSYILIPPNIVEYNCNWIVGDRRNVSFRFQWNALTIEPSVDSLEETN